VARDELTGKPVATTGAVLTIGEELRPTGTDFTLLNRIAELTGGKKRDTLAGIFTDRGARRFAYKDITAVLLLIAAIALLLAVAARRLAIPEAVSRWVRSAVSWRPFAGRALAAGATGEGKATLASLLKSKKESREQPPAVPTPADPTQPRRPHPQPAQPGWSAPGAAPAAGPAASPHAATLLATQRRPAPVASPSAVRQPPTAGGRLPAVAKRSPGPRPAAASAQGADGSPASRPLTAAEILLARRKGKRS